MALPRSGGDARRLIEHGRQEGRQEGRQRGELIGAIQTLQTALGLEAPQSAQLEAMSLDELTSLAGSLRARLPRR